MGQASTSHAPAVVGQSVRCEMEPVTNRQLVMYAGASGDFNRIHYDQDYARQAGLDGVIAHGMLTMGFAARAVTDWAGPAALVESLRGRFLSPVRPGDTVTVALSVVEVDPAGAEHRVRVDLAGAVGETAVFAGAALVRIPGPAF